MFEVALWHALKEGDLCAAVALVPSVTNLENMIHGTTFLHEACSYKQTTIVKSLLDAGASPDVYDENGTTALMYCITQNYDELTRLIISAGANLDRMHGRNTFTALHQACIMEYLHPSAKLLLQAGCCPNPRTIPDRLTPLHLAASAGAKQTVALLLDAAPQCHSDTTTSGWNALHFAVKYNKTTCMEEIYARCKVIDADTDGGETLLQIALKHGCTEAAELLRKWRTQRRLAFLAGSCLNPANHTNPKGLTSLPVDVLRIIIQKI